MIVLLTFHLDAALAGSHAPLQAGVAATAVAGKDLDAVQGRHDVALDAPRIEHLVALERAIDPGQHGFQTLDRKAGKAIAQGVVAERALDANPALQGWLREFRLALLKAGQPKHESMKGSQEHGRGRNLGSPPGILETGHGGAEVKDLIEIAGEGREFVNRPFLPSHEGKRTRP